MAIGGGRSGVRAAEATALPSVSVVLPVRREARHIGGILHQLLEQDYPVDRYEILVADGSGAEDDGTRACVLDIAARAAAAGQAPVHWLPNPGRTSAAGRNVGVRAASGDWIVFVDGHCRLPGVDWLRDTMRTAALAGAQCVARPQPLTAEFSGPWQAAIARVRATRIAHGADSTIYDLARRGWVNPSSSGAAYARCLFERFGGFDESFDACEDVEFNHRLAQAGIRAWLCPEAAVAYVARPSLGGLWRQMLRYGRGRVRLARKHRDAFSLPQCLPALWLAWLPLALAGLALPPGIWRTLAAAGLLVYMAVILVYALALACRYGWRYLLAAPAVYFTVHAGLGAGAWQEAASGYRLRRRQIPLSGVPES